MQKEKLSALIDDEILDNELLNLLSKDKALQKNWQNYHLIGDTLRHELVDPLCLDMPYRIAEAIKNDPISIETPVIEKTRIADNVTFWKKIRPWLSQFTQITVAASVSLVVVLSGQNQVSDQTESPMLNTLPMLEVRPAPVSFGIPSHALKSNNIKQKAEEDRNRLENMEALHKFELKRRMLPLSKPNTAAERE